MSFVKIAQICIITAGVLSCTGANLYKDMATNKTSDEALYEDAQKLIDDGDYTAAINKILSTTTNFQATARVKESLAGAYAARCGMEFLSFVSNLTGGSSSSMYTLAMNGFVGVDTSNYADCVEAEEVIESIGAAADLTQSQKLFMMILQMAKLGNRLRSVADVAPSATGDGTVDATFDCMDSVPIADAQAIIESFVKFLTYFALVGDSLGGGATSDSLTQFVSDYGIPDLDYGGNGPDEADATIVVSRALINSQSFGVGSCNNPDPTQCICL